MKKTTGTPKLSSSAARNISGAAGCGPDEEHEDRADTAAPSLRRLTGEASRMERERENGEHEHEGGHANREEEAEAIDGRPLACASAPKHNNYATETEDSDGQLGEQLQYPSALHLSGWKHTPWGWRIGSIP